MNFGVIGLIVFGFVLLFIGSFVLGIQMEKLRYKKKEIHKLKMRLASGDITIEQYDELKQNIEGSK